jgi:transposase
MKKRKKRNMESQFKEKFELTIPEERIHQGKKKRKSKAVFKPYNQDQIMLLPENIEELIPQNHMVRILNKSIEEMKIAALLQTYKGGGSSSYNPKMLLKVLIYSYIMGVYTSRQISKRLREDIHYMWLSGKSRPDFRTINNFRSSRLKEVIEEIFGEMVKFLTKNNYIDLKQYFIDGTKLRANSNKHKGVWKKNTERYKKQTEEKIREKIKEIERINEEENRIYGEKDLAEIGEENPITSEKIKEEVERLNKIIEKKLKNKRPTKPEKKAIRAIKEISKKMVPRLEKYEKQKGILKERNSYSKTDEDATMFRMKDGQLLPGYNLIMGTQNQYVVNYNFYQKKASESDGFTEHMNRCKKITGKYPELVVGDSAYGSEENYHYLEKEKIGNYLKYNTYHIEKTKKYKSNPYRKENFPYDKEKDEYICPSGRRLNYMGKKKEKTTTGFETDVKIYQCIDCAQCSLSDKCRRGNANRTIQINERLEKYRAQARENLETDEGIKLRKKRSIDVEPVFGDIKYNQNYQRFLLRGLKKVEIEFGILAMAHNVKKLFFSKSYR